MKKSKHFLRSNMRRILSSLIVLALLLPQTSLVSFAADGNEIIDVDVSYDGQLVEELDGYWDDDFSYFYYWLDYSKIKITVYYDNGAVLTDDTYNIESTTGEIFNYLTSSADDPWHVGINEAEYDFAGFTGTFEVEVVENPVASVDISYDGQLYENISGSMYDDGSGQEYFRYDIDQNDLYLTVTNKDGTVYEGTYWEVYEQTGLDVLLDSDQSAQNPWTVGRHQFTYSYAGITGTLDVEVLENPIQSVTVEQTEPLIENYSGNWISDEDSVDRWFEYRELDNLLVTVTYKDGTVYAGDPGSVWGETGFNFSTYTDQSSDNPWGVGVHTVEYSFAGFNGTFEVKIVENPIQSMEVTYNKTLTQYIDGDLKEDWGDNGEDYMDYDLDRYSILVTIHYTDGTSFQGCAMDLYKIGNGYTFYYYSPAEWKPGTNTVSYSYYGYEGTFDVEMIGKTVQSIDILKVLPLDEKLNNDPTYKIKYRVNFTDGTSDTCVNTAGYEDRNYAKVTYNNDGRTFTISCGGVSATGSFEMVSSPDFRYIEQAGGAIIIDYVGSDTDVVIPEEIDGLPVIGVADLGDYDYSNYKVSQIQKLTIPNSVKFLSENWASNLTGLQEIEIGAGVSNLEFSMFLSGGKILPNLKAVYVSDSNPYYMDMDGVVYSKDGKTLVFYPLAKGSAYTVPAAVTDFDILYNRQYVTLNFTANTENFITLDGVTYTKDMQKVVHCNPDKSGSYVMPESVTSVAANAFKGCNQLEEVQVSSKVTDIVYATFAECSALKTLELPETLQSVGDYAFSDCASLQSVDLSNNLQSIGDHSFYGCRSLDGIDLSDQLTSIPDNAFENCVSLKTVTLPSAVQSLGDSAFANCTALQSVKLNDSLQMISEYAFENCISLKEMTIPDSVTMLADYVFQNCSSLNSLVIGKGITKLAGPSGNYFGPFDGCTALENIVLPNGLTSINTELFNDTAYYNDPSNWKDGALYIGPYLIAVKPSVSGSYAIADGTTLIADDAFFECKLTSVTMPDSVEYVGNNAFNSCYSLKQVQFSKNIKEIGYNAFLECSLDAADLPQGLQLIDSAAFEGNNMQQITIPETVTDIVYGSFEDCVNLSQINMPDKLISIGPHVFDNTAWYNNQPNGATYIGRMLYDYKGTSPDSLVVKPGTLGIADAALETQPLEEVSLPEGLQQIGTGAFVNCMMTEVYVPESVTEIKDFALGYSVEGSNYIYADDDPAYDQAKSKDRVTGKIPGFTIYGYAGSDAERYAKENGFAFVALTKLADSGTNIVVVPAYADGALPENASLAVETISSSPTRVSYNISLMANGQAVQPDSDVAVKIPVPSGMDGAACKVYRAEADGTYTDMNAVYANGSLTFTTDHFSEYVVTTGDPTDEPQTGTLGDVDGNGLVNAADAVMVLRSDAGLTTLTAAQTAAADINGDGVVNASDAVQILRYDAGLITEF